MHVERTATPDVLAEEFRRTVRESPDDRARAGLIAARLASSLFRTNPVLARAARRAGELHAAGSVRSDGTAAPGSGKAAAELPRSSTDTLLRLLAQGGEPTEVAREATAVASEAFGGDEMLRRAAEHAEKVRLVADHRQDPRPDTIATAQLLAKGLALRNPGNRDLELASRYLDGVRFAADFHQVVAGGPFDQGRRDEAGARLTAALTVPDGGSRFMMAFSHQVRNLLMAERAGRAGLARATMNGLRKSLASAAGDRRAGRGPGRDSAVAAGGLRLAAGGERRRGGPARQSPGAAVSGQQARTRPQN